MKHNEQWDDIVYESQGYSEEALFQQSSDEVHLIISFKGSSKSSFAQEVCLMPGPVGRRTEMDMCYVFVPLGTTHSALAVIDEFLHRIRLRRIRPSDWSGNPTWEPSSSDDRGYRH